MVTRLSTNHYLSRIDPRPFLAPEHLILDIVEEDLIAAFA